MGMRLSFLSLSLLLALFACKDGGNTKNTNDGTDVGIGGTGQTTCISYDTHARSILDANCISCHPGTGTQPDLSNLTNNPSYSGIAAAAVNAAVVKGTMPPSSNGGPLSQSDRSLLTAWQNGGFLQDCNQFGSGGATTGGVIGGVGSGVSNGVSDEQFAQQLHSTLTQTYGIFTNRQRGLVDLSPALDGKHGAVRETFTLPFVTVGAESGLVVVKYNYPPAPQGNVAAYGEQLRSAGDFYQRNIAAMTVYMHRPGYNPSAGDLFWAKYDMANGQLTAIPAAGKPDGCIGCHARAGGNDWRFGN